MEDKHKYIILSDKAKIGANTDVTALLVNYYFGNKQSINKWRNDKKLYKLSWNKSDVIENSIPTNYLEIASSIREKGRFDNQEFNLPPMFCTWLDSHITLNLAEHTINTSMESGVNITIAEIQSKDHFGDNYPIEPTLKREGQILSSMKPFIMKRIMKNRSKIISESSLSLEVDWIFDVRTLINDTISLIEITLNEIYIKAEYSPLTHWKPFDKLKLGERHGRRFNDKLRWVFTITGKHLEAEKYLPSINNLRELRNHLMHFDPPSFAYSFEEVTIWLNQIIDVGYLLIKIRQAIGVNISIDLLNFILQKEAVFNPEPQYIKRLPFIDGKGDYASSTW